MSWNDIKKKYGDEQTRNINSNISNNSSWERIKKKYSNMQITNSPISDATYPETTEKKTSILQNIQNFADATGKIGENTYKGAENGILSAIQNLGRNMFNLQGRKEEENIFDKVNKQILDSRKDLSSEERTSIIDKMNNSSFSQKNLIKGIEEKNQEFQEKKNENVSKIQQNADSISNPVGKYLAGEIAPGIGQMLPGILPGIGTTYFISSATGNYHDDAIQRGMTEDQATIYSGTMGIIEGALESLGANLTKNVGKQLLKKNIKGALVNYGLDIGENFLEESIVEPISEIAAQVYGGKDKADWSDVWQRAIESGVAGALTSAITGGASAMIGGIGSKVTQQNQYVDYNTNKKLNKDSQNWLKQAENIIQENSTPKLSPQLAQNQQNTSAQQITPTIQNNVQNGISEQTNSMLNNKEVPMLNYQYEKSDNVKINNLRQDANKYFNNSEKARNYVSMLERIIADKNIDIRLDANLKTPDGKIANGSYSNGVITINPNSARAGEFIAVHELTHAIGTDSMKNIIEIYRKSNPEFNTAVEKLLQNYNSTEITEEALSDVSAQLFGNQEFINNVAQNNPNIFQKIYSEIKYLWHQFRGYKNQDQFVEDLYYKWTQAYNSSNKLNETSNYYIEPIANFNETEYNNIIEEKLTKKEYAILRSIINSDSNIKPGINYVEVTNGRYTVYYKGFDDFKVMSRKVDADAGRINKRNDTTGRKARYSKTFEQSIGNKRTTTSTDEISNINTQGTRERSGSDTSSSTNIENVKYSIQESENNSGSFNLQKNRFDVSGNENLANAQTLFYRTREDGQYYVQATDGSGKIIYDGVFYGEKQLARSLGEEIAKKIVNTSENTNNEIYLQSDNVKSETDYMMAHRPTETGAYASNITKGTGEWESLMPEDVYEHPEWYFDMKQEYSKESFKILKQIKNNPNAEITIYRATTGNKINVGDWVTLSKKYAEYHNNSQFNGKGNIVELKVKAKDVQYAGDDINEFGYFPQTNKQKKDNSDIRYSQNNGTWQSYLNNNFKSTGTRTNLQDIKNIAPIAKDVKTSNTAKVELLTDKDYEVLNEIYEKEGKTEILTEKKKAKLLEKYANDKFAIKDSLDILAQKFINKGHYIDKLSEQAKNPELKFIYDKNLNSFAEGQYVIGVAQTDNNGKKIGKSINDIWKPVEDASLTKEFSEYLLHKHNIDRSERNKFVFGKEIGPAESTKIALELEKKHPEFKQYAKDIKEFNHNNLMNLKEAGMITQETIEYMETMYPNYVPISRDVEDSIYVGDNKKVGANAPIKKATGGNSDIQPIKDTMAQQVIRIKRLINQNKLGQELSKTLKNAKVEQTSDIQFAPSNLLELDTLVDSDNKGNKYYTYFEDGILQKLKINDNLYESLRPTEINRIEKTLPLKAIQKVTSIHRSLLTSSNPIFVVTNFFKDIQDGMFNSKYSSKFIKNYGKALSEITTKGKYYESYMANGGMTNTYFDYNEGIKKKNKFTEKIRNVNEIVEQLPRLAEFISTLEDGKSLNEALYNAAEITTNFKRGGDITKAINRNGVNFLNASIQGLDKQFRNFSGQNGVKGYVNLLIKATLMGVAPAILNHMLLDDDDDYEDLPESTKDLYYLFKYNDGKFIRIPKGRVLSIFGSAARRILEMAQGQDDAFNGFKDTVINQIAPNNPLEDNILAPIRQVKNNKTWYGSDLVSSRLQKELPQNQYDETTDEFSKWLGKQLNASPKKINYLIDQYSGGIGDVILPMITPQAKKNVFVDKFTTDSVLKNKNVSKFYETLEKQTQIANDSFATEKDKLQAKYLSEVSNAMSELYKEKRKIQMSNISNSEKTKKVREIQAEINNLSEEGLKDYSNGTYKNNSAKIGDIEYYKNGKDEWVKLSDEEKENNKSISTETYAQYKQKIYKETQKTRKNGELEENQNLKKSDKISILLNSNYSNKEISSLYENYIKSENDIEYDIMKNTGIDIQEYLKYKQQEFESDKYDDGTLNGKTVAKSKQNKVVKYLNSMNIKGDQRLLLYAMQGYKTTTSQKQKLVNYIKELKIDKEIELKLYDKLNGFTVYKDRTVKY